jgi:hypothetical protein
MSVNQAKQEKIKFEKRVANWKEKSLKTIDDQEKYDENYLRSNPHGLSQEKMNRERAKFNSERENIMKEYTEKMAWAAWHDKELDDYIKSEEASRSKLLNEFTTNSTTYEEKRNNAATKSHANQQAQINRVLAARAAKKLVHGGTRKYKKNSKKSRKSRRTH